MQPPAITLTIARAAGTTYSRPRSWRDRTRRSATRRVLRLDGGNNLALLERHGGLLHDRLVALKSGLDVDCGPEVAADHPLLKAQFVSRPHDRDLGALRVEDDRGGRNPPARPGGRDLEADVDEHSGEQPARLVGDVDLRQEGPRAGIERAGGARDLARDRLHRSEERRVGEEGRSRWAPDH